jgi:HPt (histidine-containing phosphotransfer) domain-containing protein
MTNSEEIFMEELKEEFKESVANHLKDLPALFAEYKFKEIAKIAHDIKGTAGIFGYDEGTDIAKDLHSAALEKDTEKIKGLIDRLTDYMKKNNVV